MKRHGSLARRLARQVQAAEAGTKKLLRQLEHARGTVLQPEMGIDAAQQLADQLKLAALTL